MVTAARGHPGALPRAAVTIARRRGAGSCRNLRLPASPC